MKRFNQSLLSSLIALIALSLILSSCIRAIDYSIKIAISKASPDKSYTAYTNWIHSADSNLVTINMYEFTIDSALTLLEGCSGLLLTGGEDVFPGNYGKINDTARCGEFDLKRDSLELALINKALELNIPILGICRGQQIINVALGGSLIIDIPSDYDTNVIHRIPDSYKCFHDVSLENGTKLVWATNEMTGSVNSCHHQAIDLLADGLKVSARAIDGIIEAIEWDEMSDQSFLMGVQWHPEQMDLDNPLSKSVLEYFMMQIKAFKSDLR